MELKEIVHLTFEAYHFRELLQCIRQASDGKVELLVKGTSYTVIYPTTGSMFTQKSFYTLAAAFEFCLAKLLELKE